MKPFRRAWTVFRLAATRFFQIDGTQWAGAFAFNALFALFPLSVLFVTIASVFIERAQAAKEVIAYMQRYVPIGGEMKSHVFGTIAGLVGARQKVSLVALLILVWVALQCFTTLVSATNRAWGSEGIAWWRLPLNSLMLLGVATYAVLLGLAVPMLMKMTGSFFFMVAGFHSRLYALGSSLIPLAAVFFSLSLFYSIAPRPAKRLSDIWTVALGMTFLLKAAEWLFAIYLKDFAGLNAVYGAFGGIMALLLWIYISGCVLIFGACLCAARAEAQAQGGLPC